jgi:hypothetical protein
MYWLGLVILSIAVGTRYEQIDGWMVLGTGMMFFALVVGLYNTINAYLNKFAKKD